MAFGNAVAIPQGKFAALGVSTVALGTMLVDGRKLIAARSISRMEISAFPNSTADVSVTLWYSTDNGTSFLPVPGSSSFVFTGSGSGFFAPFLLPALSLLVVVVSSPTIAYSGHVSVTVD